MTKKALTVSIIIPAYNEERHLKACLDSLARQTVMPLEVIVVDNNSTDKSAAIAGRYPFVRLVTESQQGIVYARTRGFNAARGDIIGRTDADTILPPDWVERVVAYYSKKEHLGHAYTGGCYFYNIRLPHFWGWIEGQIAFRLNRLLLGHYITFGSNMALPRKLWRQVKADTCARTDIHEDLDLAIHLHRQGVPITYNETLQVGMKMRRVRSERDQLMANLMLWPQTLRVHGLWTWVFGWIGAILVYCAWPIGPLMEWVARLFGRPPLAED